ncbi:MAG: HAD family hydrolase [Clostridia bacterium]
MSNQKLVVFDFDGTVFKDFLLLDRYIITSIYEITPSIRFIEKYARMINDLDIVANNIGILKFRLWLYYKLSSKIFKRKISFKQILKKYEILNTFFAQLEIRDMYDKYLSQLENAGFVVKIISNNLFNRFVYHEKVEMIQTQDKQKELEKLAQKYDIAYMVGNNFTDDILSAYYLKIKSIYVGKSKIFGLFKKLNLVDFTSVNLAYAIKIILQK